MANQLNFSTQITNSPEERPLRLDLNDYNLVVQGEFMKVFGSNIKDNIEVWFYYPDGTFASTVRIPITDASIMLSTMYDTSGYFEYINVNIETVAEYAKLSPGRYSVVIYFFMDEVGSRGKQKLYIKDVSPSRTEIRLSPIKQDVETATEIFEFVVPSVPRIFANGIIDEIFGNNLDVISGEYITVDDIKNGISNIDSTIDQKLNYIAASQSFDTLLLHIINSTYSGSLDYLKYSTDPSVQLIELQTFISSSIQDTIRQYELTNNIDPRFKLI